MDYSKLAKRVKEHELKLKDKADAEYSIKKEKIERYEVYLRSLLTNKSLEETLKGINNKMLSASILIASYHNPSSSSDITDSIRLEYNKEIKQLAFLVTSDNIGTRGFKKEEFTLKKSKMPNNYSKENQELYGCCFKDDLVLSTKKIFYEKKDPLLKEYYYLFEGTTPEKVAKKFNVTLKKAVDQYISGGFYGFE